MKNNVTIESKRIIDKDTSDVKALIIYSLCLLVSMSVLGFGIWRISYKKILESRMGYAEGTVVRYTHDMMQGKVMYGLYNLYVKYEVDGVYYEGHNGTTASEPKTGMKVTVRYDTKHPDRILVLDEMGERTIYFLIIGTVFTVFFLANLIPKIIEVKKKASEKALRRKQELIRMDIEAGKRLREKELSKNLENVNIKDLKDGYYTFYQGKEYKLVSKNDLDMGVYVAYLMTRDANLADDSFTENVKGYEDYYAKRIELTEIGDVREYHLAYYLLGNKEVQVNKIENGMAHVTLGTEHERYAESHGFNRMGSDFFAKDVQLNQITFKEIDKGLTSHFKNLIETNKEARKLKEWDMRGKNAQEIGDIIYSKVGKETCDSMNFHVGELVEKPNQCGFFMKNSAWYIYRIDEKNLCTITGPFNEKAVVFACAKLLHAEKQFEVYRFTEEERDIYIEKNYHSVSEL